jgi:transposase
MIFGIKASTAHATIRRYEESGDPGAAKRGGHGPKKTTPNSTNSVLDWIDNCPDMTLQSIFNRLEVEKQITVSKKTVARMLTKEGFTFKLTKPIPSSRFSPDVIRAHKEYAMPFHQDTPLDSQSVIWVNETGFNLHLRRKHGRARAGLRANLTVANNRGHNISICGVMSEEGFIAHKVHFGAYNTVAFCEFLEILFAKLCELNRAGCRIILDNVRFHHCEVVARCAQQARHFLHFCHHIRRCLTQLSLCLANGKHRFTLKV